MDSDGYMSKLTVSPAEVIEAIKELRSSDAVAYDSMSNNDLKELRTLVPILTDGINLPFSSGIFPDTLKRALVIPLYEKGSKNEIGNYRPISLLPVLGELMEI